MISTVRKILAASFLLGVCFAPLTAFGAIVEIGEILLEPNQAGQVVRLHVSGGEAVQGLIANFQVGDGGPELVNFGVDAGTPGPKMTAIDLENGIFAGNASFQSDLLLDPDQGWTGSIPQLASYNVSTASGSIPASGVLATITFDTTGFFAGEEFPFNIVETLLGPTGFVVAQDIFPVTAAPGTIRIIPEPSSLLLAFGGLGMGCVVYFGRRRKSAR